MENSVTLVQNKNQALPIENLGKNKVAYVKLGKHNNSVFVKRLNDYTKVDVISGNSITEISNKLKGYETVIVSFHTSLGAYANYKIDDDELLTLQEISKN